ALLASINVDPADSEVVLKKIATEDVIKQDLSDSLQVNQPITLPQINNSELSINQTSDKTAVEAYLSKTVPMVQTYNTKTALAKEVVFTDLQNSSTVDQAIKDTKQLAQNLRGTPVPLDLVEYHKAKIATYEQYADFLNLAKFHQAGAYDLTNPA